MAVVERNKQTNKQIASTDELTLTSESLGPTAMVTDCYHSDEIKMVWIESLRNSHGPGEVSR